MTKCSHRDHPGEFEAAEIHLRSHLSITACPFWRADQEYPQARPRCPNTGIPVHYDQKDLHEHLTGQPHNLCSEDAEKRVKMELKREMEASEMI